MHTKSTYILMSFLSDTKMCSFHMWANCFPYLLWAQSNCTVQLQQSFIKSRGGSNATPYPVPIFVNFFMHPSKMINHLRTLDGVRTHHENPLWVLWLSKSAKNLFQIKYLFLFDSELHLVFNQNLLFFWSLVFSGGVNDEWHKRYFSFS